MKSFVKELVLTNYFLLALFVLIIIAGNIVYGGNIETLSKTLPILIIIFFAMVFKIKRIKAKGDIIDERLQIITYKAVNIGFYCVIGAIFWFYTKEIIAGQVSVRTIVELIAGVVGYLGGVIILSKRY